ncbi:hypothetical protein GGF32_009441 [Allomyces javanicus]|nr:hypothetical protein GGF32_009441 [Allomyces javanicus]
MPHHGRNMGVAQDEPSFDSVPLRPQFHDEAHYFGPGLARDPIAAPTTVKPHRFPEYRAPFQSQREPNTWRPSRRVYHSSGIGTGGSNFINLPHRRQYHGPPFGDLFERLQQVPGVSERDKPTTTFLSCQLNRSERYPSPPPPSTAPPPPPTRAMDFHIDHDPLAPPRLDTLTDAPLLRTVYFADPATRDLAAAELAKRAWRYHPHLRRWFAPNPGKHDFYKVYDLANDQVREFAGATLRATAVAAERGDADALSVLDADTPAREVQGQMPMPIGVRQAQVSLGTAGQPQMPVGMRSISPPQATVDARIMVSSRQQQQQQPPHLAQTDNGQHHSHGSGRSDFRMPGPATTHSTARSPLFTTTAVPGLAAQPYFGPRHTHALQHPTPRADAGCTASNVASSASMPGTGMSVKDSAHASVEDLRVLAQLQEELAAVAASGGAHPSRAAVHELLQSVHQILQNQAQQTSAGLTDNTAAVVSRDTVLAHTVLLAAFHQLRDDQNEAKNLAFLCTSEARYLAFMRALAKAVVMDASLIENPPLPPLDVAMFWHSHMLSPIRFSDDMQRCFGHQMRDVDFPLLRMAKVISGANKADLEAGRVFWAAHMPADMPYDLTPELVDETKTTAKVVCPTCQTEQTMDMAKYAVFRLHAKEHLCASCACEFTAENVAVDRFLKLVASTPTKLLAGTQLHPKTQLPVSNDRANFADIAALFAKDEWAKRIAKLPFLATWDDVKSRVFGPIIAAKRDALVLPGNRYRFGMILRAHQDVTNGPWSMDMVRAVRRQQRFSSKIAAQLQHGGVHRIYHLHTEALVQYPKFLAMLVVKPHMSLVPTTSIDLAWHTHQLFPSKYTSHTMALAGHVVNHDDSDDAVSEERIAEGAKAMPDAWMEVYDEDYFAPNVSCATGDKYKVDSLDYHDVAHTFTCCFAAAKGDTAGLA